ncbi:MAG TPA: sulfurtransferase TusA family protein [Thermodesulfovibrionales bacterium]|nr:sulfurtransferase TusA family protein [Thermodesulfovibrionales bacterium]
MNSLLPGDTLDLRGAQFPLHYVKTKRIIKEMSSGELLEILLDDGDPIRDVPRKIIAEGHDVVGVEKLNDGSFTLFVRKG